MAFEPYENQLIGAFLFQLGRMTPKDQTTTINLFQQTPLDRAFGDLVVGTHRCFVLEFKRSSKQLAMEARKWTERGLQELLGGRLDQSLKGHFIIYGLLTDDTVDMHMCRYLSALNSTTKLNGVPADEIIRYLALGVFSRESQTAGSASAPRRVVGLALMRWSLTSNGYVPRSAKMKKQKVLADAKHGWA
jgi:hypothetical protein